MNVIRWKFVAVIAILAMAVSLLSGGLSGVGLGVLLLRTLIGGVLFAALAVVLNLLIARVFPEILEFSDESGTTGETDSEDDLQEGTGTRVNIVMPAESPGTVSSEDDLVFPAAGESADSGVSETPGDNNDEEIEEAEPMGDLDRFSGDFSDVGESKSSRSSIGDGVMGNHDFEEVAQAIHTVISRDEKG